MILSYKEGLSMIVKSNIITDIEIKTKEDLIKLKAFMEAGGMKVNKSQIARELNIDRRTVDKYLNGFKKTSTRNRSNCLTDYYNIIEKLIRVSKVFLHPIIPVLLPNQLDL